MLLQDAKPEMLTLARQSRKLTQAQLADKVGVAQGTISKYEAGVIPISDDDLSKISDALDYPQHFFRQIARVEGPGISESFHRNHLTNVSALTLHRIYALAEIRRIEAQKLLKSWPSPDVIFPKYPVDDYDGDVEKIARTVRALWQVPQGPVFSMTQVVEQAGSIIFQFDFGTRHVDALSTRSASMQPLFFMNEDVPPDRWRWTLAHELGHMVMHFEPSQSPKETEEQANQFAGEFLAPAHELRSQLWGLDFQKLAGLKQYWKISMQALIMRAYHLGAITERQRREMFMRLSKAGYRLREPAELDPAIEPPVMCYRLIKFHQENLGYDETDIYRVLAINENDLKAFYRSPLDRLTAIK